MSDCVERAGGGNSKFQIPNPKQIPMPKREENSKRTCAGCHAQAQLERAWGVGGDTVKQVWHPAFWSLEFGVWDLVLGISTGIARRGI